MALNIDELIAKLQDKGNITINVINVSAADDIADLPDDITPVSDFTVGDRVMVYHVRKDGTPVFTDGTVSSIGSDDKGDYVRVDGDNGKHYKCGLRIGEDRLGSSIIRMV